MNFILKLNKNNWQDIKRMLKASYLFLTESDLEFKNNDEQILVGRLSAKLKLPIEKVQELLLKMKAGIGSGETIPIDIAVV